MQSSDRKGFLSLRADANVLGGVIEEPFNRVIPTQAPVSLPAVGGFTAARAQGFNFDELISFSSAYSRVSGTQCHEDGSHSILVTAAVEDLNILELVRAERIVAQVSITIPEDNGAQKISLAGSSFDGLRLAGVETHPIPNVGLQRGTPDSSGNPTLTWPDFQRIAGEQAGKLISGYQDRGHQGALAWAKEKYEWLTPDRQNEANRHVRCSLVDGLNPVLPGQSSGHIGHIVEIPGFGRIFLGELLVSRDSVQLVAVRAELKCPVRGKIVCLMAGGGGDHG